MSWNVNGLSDSKILLHSYDVFFQQFDLILLQETRCTHVDPNIFPGYKIFTTPVEQSSSKRGYGLITAVRETALVGAQFWSHTSSSLWVCLRFWGDLHPRIYVGNVYIPPVGSPLLSTHDLEWRFGELSGKVTELEGDTTHIFMGGDFNGHVEYASSSATLRQGKHVGQNRGGRLMVKLAEETNLSICTGRVVGDLHFAATYRATQRSSPTRPDHILVSTSLLPCIESAEVQSEVRGSDHLPIVTKVSLAMAGPTHAHQDRNSGRVIRAINWQRASRIPYVESLERANTRLNECIQMANEGNVANALDALSGVVVNAAIEAGMPLRVRSKGQGRFRKPFFNEECQRLKREWRRAGRQYGYQFEEVRLLERKYHAYVRSQKRAWSLAQLQERLNMFHVNPRRFWQMFRGPDVGLPIPLLSHDAWDTFMTNLISFGPSRSMIHSITLSPVAYPPQSYRGEISDDPFTIVEVELGLMKLKNGRSYGFTGYPAELLQQAQRPLESEGPLRPHLLAPTLLAVLNGLFVAGSIPMGHNVLKVTPVLKDSGKSILDTTNYRPIAVPEPGMRLYATLLNERLVQHLESLKYRCEAQVGFRPGFSTLHQLFALQHFIDRATHENPLLLCKLDLSKAYDRVPRELLWEALRRVGVNGVFLEAIKSLYEDANITLSVGGTYGELNKPGSGITQGSPLSPTLFGVFSDGLIRFIEAKCPNMGPKTRDGRHVPIQGYADDFKLLATSWIEMQHLLQAVAEWCAMTLMEIQDVKCHVMVFPHEAVDLSSQPCTYRGTPLKVVTQCRHLGIVISSVAGVGETFGHLRGKMWGAWSSIQKRYGNLDCAPSIGILIRLFLTCVVPTASYACEIWGSHTFPKPLCGISVTNLENDFLSMLRMIIGVRRTVRTDVLLCELGIRPLRHQWLKRMATFWNSLCDLPEDHMYASILRDSCYYGVTTHRPTWAGSFMRALIKIGYPYPVDCHSAHKVDMDTFRATLTNAQRLSEEGLHISPRLAPKDPQLCTYLRWFARTRSTQRDILLSLPVSVKRIRQFFKFRLGVHDLPIDVGRRQLIPRSQRLCDMCGIAVGDEHHFVFHCPALAQVRDRYPHLFSSSSWSLRNFIWQQDQVAVVNFVFDAFQARLVFQGR